VFGSRGVIVRIAPKHRFRFDDILDAGYAYTDVLDRDIDLDPVGPALFVAEDAIIATGTIVRGTAFTTNLRRVRVTDIQAAGEWELSLIADALPTGMRDRFLRVAGGGSLPPATWRYVVEAIRTLDADVAARLDSSFEEELEPRELHTPREERDAFLLSLDIAGFDRRALRLSLASETHFLEGADEIALLEDHIVSHDALAGLSGWDRDIDPPRAYRFVDPDGRALTVMNVNRDRVENALGVDLLYWREQPDSFVLVQYKRLLREGDAERYRPSRDKNFAAERKRMTEVRAEVSRLMPTSARADEYRFVSDPFFLKFCSARQPIRSPSRLMTGMYVPIAYFDALEADGSLVGPKGGLSIGWDNARRWLKNTSFTELVADYWLGTSGQASRFIAALIRTSLGLHRAVIVAAERGTPLRAGQRRRRANNAEAREIDE
jgi:hypothetical protein